MIATDVVTRCSAATVFNYISLNSDTPHSLSRHLPPAARTEQWETLAENQAAVHTVTVTVCRVQPLFTRSLINQKFAVAIKIFNFTKNIYNSPLCWIMKRMCSAAARWWLLGMQQQPAVTVYREGTLWPPTVLQSTIRRVSSVCRDNRPGHLSISP